MYSYGAGEGLLQVSCPADLSTYLPQGFNDLKKKLFS